MEFEPWTCPQCGRENDGFRGFCGSCSYQRPFEERFAERAAPGTSALPDASPASALPPRGTGPSLPALALAWLVLVAGLGVVAFLVNNRDTGPRYPKAWDSRVEPIARFVEKERELRFDHPVAVNFLPVAEFKKKVGEGKPPTKAERRQFEDQVAEMRAVGLVSGDFDLAAATKQLVTESVIGYYDPDTKRVFVRGDQLTPDVRVTLAHELTHALQDQHYDLRLFRDDTTGQAGAYRALYEADAVRIEDTYQHDQLTAAETAEFEQARTKDRQEANVKSIPAVISDGFAFPYVAGPYFVKALTDAGGNARVDQAFARPPASDAEIVSPELYLDGFAPDEVAPPRLASGEKRFEKPSTVGQVLLLEVLGARLGYVKAWAAVRGWKGDSSVGYRKDGKVCVAIETTFSSDGERDRFEAASTEWAKAMPAASVQRDGNDIVIRSCDPGGGFKAPAQDPSPFDALQARAAIAQQLREDGHLEAPVAACTADRLIGAVGPKVALSRDSDLTPDQLGFVIASARDAAARCRANPADRG